MAGTAVDRWVTEFEAFCSNGAAGAPEWVQGIRRDAIDRFVARGFPTAREEAWRFTNTSDLQNTVFARASAVEISDAALAPHVIGGADALLAVSVNGHYAAPNARLGNLPDGVTVMSLADACRDRSDLVRAHLSRHAPPAATPFDALGTAFLHDGFFVHVARGVTVEQPIELLHVAVPGEVPVAMQARSLVVLETGGSAAVIETFVGGDDRVAHWTNAVNESVVGEDARLETSRIQREGPSTFHTASVQSGQQRASRHQILSFVFGGDLTRIDAGAVLDGEGAECTMNGLVVAHGKMHVDHHTTLDHAQPHCNSWEFFNGIYDEQARGVFTGRIIVRPGAQKTDSKQTSNNLLLSSRARADSQPQLEIYADDVRCTHGATLGPIDERHVFYLQSRGLSRTDARNLLTWGFGSEILSYVSHAPLKAVLERTVHALLDAGAQRRGEG